MTVRQDQQGLPVRQGLPEMQALPDLRVLLEQPEVTARMVAQDLPVLLARRGN